MKRSSPRLHDKCLRTRPCVDPLEPRRLLSVAPQAIPETLVVTGTDGDDTIDVSPSADGSQVVVTLNGAPAATDASAVLRVDVSGLAGNDRLTVSPALTALVSFDGGDGTLDRLDLTGTDGNDTFDLGATQASLNGRPAATYTSTVEQVHVNGSSGDDTANAPPNSVRGPRFFFDGGAGADALVILPPETSPSFWYLVSPTTIGTVRGPWVSVDYSNVETADVTGGHIADTFSVLGTPVGTAITLHAGSGSDLLSGSPFANQNPLLDLSSLRGGLAFDGGAVGGDTVEVGDNLGPTPDLAPRSYTVSADGIALDTGSAVGRLRLSGSIGRAKLLLGASPDTVRFTPAPATNFTLEADYGGPSAGDRLEIHPDGATRPVRLVNEPYIELRFGNRASFLFRGFETWNDITRRSSSSFALPRRGRYL